MKHLRELTALDGVSGREDAPRRYLLEKLRENPLEKEISVDPLGNILVRVIGAARPNTRVMFEAHMDEVGLMITGITADGFLRFAAVGGIDEKVLPGRRVRVNGHAGVIGCKAVHHCSKEERARPIAAEQLMVDIGAATAAEAESVVSVGDMAVFDTAYTPLYGQKVQAKALDDRAGCALLLSLLEQPPAYDVWLAFTVQEEVGLRGAGPAAYTLKPQVSVSVEATTASDIAGTAPGKEVCFVGQGAVLSFMDGRTVYDASLYRRLTALAAEHGIAVQPKRAVAGGNNAGAIQTAGAGARVAALSLPCRYIHSGTSVLSEQDWESARALLRVMADTLPGETV